MRHQLPAQAVSDTQWRRPDRQPSKLMLNFGMIGGRVHAGLGCLTLERLGF
jgi:hypothetical protein